MFLMIIILMPSHAKFSLKRCLPKGICNCTCPVRMGSCSSMSTHLQHWQCLPASSPEPVFVVHTSSNDCHANQLLQMFKVHHFDPKGGETTVHYCWRSPNRCPVFSAGIMTPVGLASSPLCVLFTQKGWS